MDWRLVTLNQLHSHSYLPLQREIDLTKSWIVTDTYIEHFFLNTGIYGEPPISTMGFAR